MSPYLQLQLLDPPSLPFLHLSRVQKGRHGPQIAENKHSWSHPAGRVLPVARLPCTWLWLSAHRWSPQRRLWRSPLHPRSRPLRGATAWTWAPTRAAQRRPVGQEWELQPGREASSAGSESAKPRAGGPRAESAANTCTNEGTASERPLRTTAAGTWLCSCFSRLLRSLVSSLCLSSSSSQRLFCSSLLLALSTSSIGVTACSPQPPLFQTGAWNSSTHTLVAHMYSHNKCYNNCNYVTSNFVNKVILMAVRYI